MIKVAGLEKNRFQIFDDCVAIVVKQMATRILVSIVKKLKKRTIVSGMEAVRFTMIKYN